jgi:hypothetical protein
MAGWNAFCKHFYWQHPSGATWDRAACDCGGDGMSKLLINEHPLQVLPTLAELIGLNEAIALQQLHYWLGRSENIRDGRKWSYKTYKEWQEENFPFWTVNIVGNVFRSLEESGLVLARKFEKENWVHRKWYTIDYEKLDALSLEGVNPHHRRCKSAPSNVSNPHDLPTENTTETTTENTTTAPVAEKNKKVSSEKNKNTDERYGGLVREMESITGTINMATANFLDGLLEDWDAHLAEIAIGHTDQAVDKYDAALAAIREGISSAKGGRPNHKYIQIILDRWVREGFKSSKRSAPSTASTSTAIDSVLEKML